METELPYRTCRELLHHAVVGRVAMSTPGGPRIVPVNYSVDGESLVICTTPHSTLATYGEHNQVAFEVDHLDHEYGTAWSVVALGRAEVISDPEEIASLRGHRGPRPWAGAHRDVYLRLRWDHLGGRRIGSGWPHAAPPVG